MSEHMAGGAVLTRDPEDVFDLPPFYRHVRPLDRERQTSVVSVLFDRQGAGPLDYRQHDRLRFETLVNEVLGAPQSDPRLVSAMQDTDVVDLYTQTPLQAAVVDAALDQLGIATLVVLWGSARGLAFAFEAFIEYCHLHRGGDFVAPVPQTPELLDYWPEVQRLADFVQRAPDQDHAEVMAVAERLRGNALSGFTRALTTFMFPQKPEWFQADLSAAKEGLLSAAELLSSVATAEQASALAEQLRELPEWQWQGNPEIELTYLNAAGPDALQFLLAWCDSGHRCPPPVKGRPRLCAIHTRCLDLIARIPSEAAMAALVERSERDVVCEYLQAAAKRFPRRAFRILAEAEPAEETTRLLTGIVLADPGFARAEAGRLSPQARDRVEASLVGDTSAAGVADLPELLAAPPWRDKKRKRVKPVVVAGLTPPAEVKVSWLPGEREAWLTAHGAGWVPDQGWEAVLAEIADGTGSELLATYFAAYAPEELVRPRLDTWQPPLRMLTNRARTFVAKYEILALPTVLSMARVPAVRAQLLQPFVSPEIAAIMVDGLARLRSVRGRAGAWLRRHPEDAVRCLVPTALGKSGRVRQNTVAALRLLEADDVDVVAIAQQAYGEDIGTAIKEVLADRGLEAYPRTPPEAPPWARAALLSEIRLKDGRTPLSHSAAQAVVEMLMFSKPDSPYPGLEIVKEVCDTSSLAEFAWSLFESWEQMGAPEKERWAFGGLGMLGDESTVLRLRKAIREWRGQSRTQHVYDGFDALAMIGGDRALAALHTFSRLSWTPKIKRRAQAKFDDVAQSMDLTADQLADRAIPTLGLPAEGTLQLDYGRRRFEVFLDELLRPVVVDESGSVLRTLPKPGKRDDSELATASYKRFSLLKKETQDLAQEQAVRLEQAMVGRRRWSPEEFDAYLVPHLLLGRIVRRLVWGVYAEGDQLTGSFRVAEDLSFADVDDARFEVPQGALVGVAHPVDLAEALGRWSEVFSDYEILQPFDQLGRPPLELSAEDRAGKCLVRPYIYPDVASVNQLMGLVRTSPGWFDGLLSRGWQPGPIGADRLWSRLLRPVGAGRHVVVDFEPGLEAGAVAQSNYQAITAVWLSVTGDEPDFGRHVLPLSELDAASASVLLRDLEKVG